MNKASAVTSEVVLLAVTRHALCYTYYVTHSAFGFYHVLD